MRYLCPHSQRCGRARCTTTHRPAMPSTPPAPLPATALRTVAATLHTRALRHTLRTCRRCEAARLARPASPPSRLLCAAAARPPSLPRRRLQRGESRCWRSCGHGVTARPVHTAVGPPSPCVRRLAGSSGLFSLTRPHVTVASYQSTWCVLVYLCHRHGAWRGCFPSLDLCDVCIVTVDVVCVPLQAFVAAL